VYCCTSGHRLEAACNASVPGLACVVLSQMTHQAKLCHACVQEDYDPNQTCLPDLDVEEQPAGMPAEQPEAGSQDQMPCEANLHGASQQLVDEGQASRCHSHCCCHCCCSHPTSDLQRLCVLGFCSLASRRFVQLCNTIIVLLLPIHAVTAIAA